MAISSVQPSLIQSCQLELGRFFQLFGEGVKGLTMPSELVDSVWHNMLENESEYKKFCMKHAGKRVGHDQDPGEGTVRWVHEYEKRFGSLHPVWFMDASGQFDLLAYNSYKATGEWIRGSWRCRPDSGDDDDGN